METEMLAKSRQGKGREDDADADGEGGPAKKAGKNAGGKKKKALPARGPEQ
jgi:hypothetical protein